MPSSRIVNDELFVLKVDFFSILQNFFFVQQTMQYGKRDLFVKK